MFEDNEIHGKGVFCWKDNRKYVGEYEHSLKQGYGEYFWPDKSYYKGYWHKGKQHGQALYRDAEGTIKHGTWSMNSLKSTIQIFQESDLTANQLQVIVDQIQDHFKAQQSSMHRLKMTGTSNFSSS